MPTELQAELSAALLGLGPAHVPRTHNKRSDGSPRYTNRLILESSPYLVQHAHNPVNWYPWGDDAFEAARRLGRPVLVSIGYSTCHWCHVMEEESFDDPDVARLLNSHFIAIKVDRESRPDVDSIYMSAIQALGQRGGWPLNVWVTPDRTPFYAGTYFPPRSTGRRPGFTDVLMTISERWQADPEELRQIGTKVGQLIAERLEGEAPTSERPIDARILARAKKVAASEIDRDFGGIGQSSKFPSATPLRFLLRHHQRTGDPESLQLAVLTLDGMARGGIHDQIGGGFHRYSTEPRWLVPHFEKMLYDNALLATIYLEASQITGRADFARIARDIVDYVLRDMTSPEGGFYSATDADSPDDQGGFAEGWYFTWTNAELSDVLGERSAKIMAAWYGVTPAGNFEGRNILNVPRSSAEAAAALKIPVAELEKEIGSGRLLLLEARARRPAPLRDDKVLSGWNGLMISAMARAGFVLDDDRYVSAARRAAVFTLERLRTKGRLHRVYRARQVGGPAFLEDHAFLIAGLLDLYEADPDPRWLKEAISLQASLDLHYADATGGGYFRTADDAEGLLVREKPGRDGAEPSGNSVSALNLLRLAEFTLDSQYRERAAMLVSTFQRTLEEQPLALAEMLLAIDFMLDAPLEIVIVTPPGRDGEAAMLAPLRTTFVPNRILAVVEEGDDFDAHARLVPLAKGRRALQDRTTAYVCVDRVCSYPTTEPATLETQLTTIVSKRESP